MKIRNYIIISGLLLFSSAPVLATNSIVPWSFSRASSSALSAMGSWGSSALSGISAFSTETKIATLGGLSMLTGGYLGYKYIKKSNDPNNQFRDWLNNSNLPVRGNPQLAATSEPSSSRRYSVSDSSTILNMQQRPRSQSVSAVDVTSCIQSPQMLSENIQAQIARLAVRSLRLADLHQLQRRVFTGRRLPQVSNTINLYESNLALAAIRAQERSQEVQRVMEESILSKIQIFGDDFSGDDEGLDEDLAGPFKILFKKSGNNGYEVDGLSGRNIRHLFEGFKVRKKKQDVGESTFEMLPLDMVRAGNRLANRDKLRRQSAESEFVDISTEDCASLRRTFIERGKKIVGQLNKREERYIITGLEAENAIVSLVANGHEVAKGNDFSIQLAGDFVIRCWSKIQQEKSYDDFSTYVGANGSLVFVLPPNIKQSCIFPDGVSHLEFFPQEAEVRVNLLCQNEAPSIKKSFESYVKYGFSQISKGFGEIFKLTGKSIKTTTKVLEKKRDGNIAYQNRCLLDAVARGDKAIILWAYANGADVNCFAKNNDSVGFRPLHIATATGQTDVVKLLLEMGANPSLSSWNSSWASILPLHLAVKEGNKRILELLMENSTNLSARVVNLDNGQSFSALDLAKNSGNVAVVKAFFKKQYKNSFHDMYGDSPKLVYLDTIWNAFGVNTSEVLIWKKHVIDCAYKEMEEKYNKKLAKEDLSTIGIEKLKLLKGEFDSLFNKISVKARELDVAFSESQIPIRDHSIGSQNALKHIKAMGKSIASELEKRSQAMQ